MLGKMIHTVTCTPRKTEDGNAIQSTHGVEAHSKMSNRSKTCWSSDIWMTFPMEDGQAKPGGRASGRENIKQSQPRMEKRWGYRSKD